MRRFRLEAEQGGSVVEFALVTMLCVPMVIYSIYAGEAFVASIKAQEAEISAGWEATAYLTHAYKGGSASSLLRSAADSSALRVKKDLKDFDSYDTRDSRDGYLGVFGFDKLEDLKCTPRSDVKGFKSVLASNLLHEDGWIGCRARVSFENRKAATDAHFEFFKAKPKIIQDTFKHMNMCGSGDNLKGCGPPPGDGQSELRGFVVFTDDWGLENPAAEPVGSNGGGNPEYYAVGKPMFTATGSTNGLLTIGLMAIVTGFGDHGDTDTFKMGYLSTIKSKRSFSSHGGSASLHLTTSHEIASEANGNTKDLSQDTYDNKRNKTNYLGFKNYPNWNGQ